MPTLNRRVAALEQAMPSVSVRAICVRFMRPGDQTPALTAVTFNGHRFDRQHDESANAFIDRVIGNAKGVPMVFEAVPWQAGNPVSGAGER